MSTCSSYGCFSWQTWLCNTACPLWSLSAVPDRELVCKQAVLLVNKQGFSPLVLPAVAENKHFRWRHWTLIFFHQTVQQFRKKHGLLGLLWHLQSIYCIRKSCVLLDPQLKYPTISLVDAFISDAGTYPGAKICLQFSLWNLGAQTGVEKVISATVYIQFIIYYFFSKCRWLWELYHFSRRYCGHGWLVYFI